MSTSKEDMLNMDPEAVFEWEVEALDAGLKEFGVTIGKTWTKSEKAFELNKTILDSKAKEAGGASSQEANNQIPNSDQNFLWCRRFR